jgi:hypothetical protein
VDADIATQPTNDAAIEIKLVRSSFLTRWPCTVCGDCTEKVSVLAEAPMPDAGLPSGWPMNPAARVMSARRQAIRVCETCLEAGNIDERLAGYADRLEASAHALRSLIGRLRVPTYAQWQAEHAYEEGCFSLWQQLREAEAAGQQISSRDEMTAFLILHAPDMLPHADRVLAEWRAGAQARAEAREQCDYDESIPF